MADDLETLGRELRELPRVERVERLFGFEPKGWQADLLETDSPDNSINASRQVGKSEVGGVLAADAALRLSGETVAILARWQDTADEMFERMAGHFRATGLSDEQLGVEQANKREWKFDNGTRAISRPLPHDADSFRGKLPRVVVVDEAALVADEVFSRVIEPMFITHGSDHELYVMSTPRGKSGYHYRKHEEDPDFASFHAAAPDFPLADDEYLSKIKAKADDLTWRQEYLGEFVEVGEAYLPRSVVEPCVSDGAVSRSRGARAWLGVDVARAGEDRSVYLSVDENGHVFDVTAIDRETIPEAVDRIQRLEDEHRYDGILVDETGGLGAAVSDYTADLPHVEPVTFTSRSKATMYQSLKRKLEAGELTLPDDDRLIHELTSLTFSYTSTGVLQVEARPGERDDMPDSLALAVTGMTGGATDRDKHRSVETPVLGSVRELRPRRSPVGQVLAGRR